MRLFIAINFNDEVKDRLNAVIAALRSKTQRGSFTLKENLHLTLAFIGETQRKTDIIKIIKDIHAPGFEMSIEGLGRFKRDDGDIYWIGVQKNAKLETLRQELCNSLINSGFEIDRREFNPHLTLGRRVIVSDSFNRSEFVRDISRINTSVNKISLMKSERIDGRLAYTEIYAKELEV